MMMPVDLDSAGPLGWRQHDTVSREATVADKTACTGMPIRESHSFGLPVHT